MPLKYINEAIAEYEGDVSRIEQRSIPNIVKERIIDAWGAEGHSNLSGIELATSGNNFSAFSNRECFIAAVASNLVVELKKYQGKAKEFFESISSREKSFKDEFQDKKSESNLPAHWDQLELLISQSPLNDKEKENLIGFIVNPASFGGCKGIGRDDFFTPSVCRPSIELTVTHHSRIARLAEKMTVVPALVTDLLNLAFGNVDNQDVSSLIGAFSADLSSSNIIYSETLYLSFCASLQAKSFAILTGVSGSGKTLVSQIYSKWLSEAGDQTEIISVGADWTSNENLLGYPDALKEKSYRKPDNGALDLVLRAKDDPDNPYFLILDEMNLSHVERYFADFLSAMESGEAINLHDGDENELWNTDSGGLKVPGKLTIPKNLFVIGTVNVDETTYMFSPKVLDRANVIEFRVSDEEMKTFLANPVKPELAAIAGQGVSYARDFVAAAKQKEFDLEEQDRVAEVLMKFFEPLQEAGAEFGYRTAHEISRFVYFHKELSGEGWELNGAMDAAIMQKLLPKLHGSKKKLGPILAALIRLCLKEDVRSDDDTINMEELTKKDIRFPNSLEKLVRMQKRLAEHGFTSFAEA